MDYSKLLDWSPPLSGYAALSGGVNAWGLGGMGAVKRGGFGSSGALGSATTPIIAQMRRLATTARNNNAHVNGVMASPPTVTANGTTLPAFGTVSYNYGLHPEVWKVSGGTIVTVGGLNRVRSAIQWTTGGNLGSNNGANGVVWRGAGQVNAAKVAFRVGPSTAKYRFIVDDGSGPKYVDTTGINTVASSGTTQEYITLDFTSVGGKASRTIWCEGQLDNSFMGAYVGAGDTISLPSQTDMLRGILVGDSYVQSSGATARGDGWGMYLGDYLGIRDMWLSGVGGSGWVANGGGTVYQFGQRTTDWLNFSPDVVFFHGSYNDRNSDPATITANALTALQATRTAFPKLPIFVFGAFAGASGPSAGILAAEAAVQSAVSQMSGSLIKFIPVSTVPWISGTGFVGSPTGVGNSDIYTSSDAVHPTDAGHAYIGGLAADAVISALNTMH